MKSKLQTTVVQNFTFIISNMKSTVVRIMDHLIFTICEDKFNYIYMELMIICKG